MRKTRLELQNQHIFKLSIVENIVKKKNEKYTFYLSIGSPKNQGFWLLNPKRSLNPAGTPGYLNPQKPFSFRVSRSPREKCPELLRIFIGFDITVEIHRLDQ